MENMNIDFLKQQIKSRIPYVLFEEVEEVALSIKRIVESILTTKILITVDVSGNEIEAYAGYNIYLLEDDDLKFIDTVNVPVVWSQNPKEN